VVLRDVPPHTTAVGVPARIVGRPTSERPSLEMDQSLPGTEGEGI
jgi:serine O-acetyltransferase